MKNLIINRYVIILLCTLYGVAFNGVSSAHAKNTNWSVSTVPPQCFGKAPQLFSASTNSPSLTKRSISFSWSVNDAPEFEVYYRVKNSGTLFTMAGTTSKYHYTIRDLQLGTTYEYKVVAKCSDGSKAESSIGSIHTNDDSSLPFGCVGYWSGIDPFAISSGFNYISITWGKATGAEFTVWYRKKNTGNFVSMPPTTKTTTRINSLSQDTEYEFFVEKRCPGGDVTQSSVRTAITKKQTHNSCWGYWGGIRETLRSTGWIKLFWHQKEGAQYKIWYREKRKFGEADYHEWESTNIITGGSYTIHNLYRNTTYEIEVYLICSGHNDQVDDVEVSTTDHLEAFCNGITKLGINDTSFDGVRIGGGFEIFDHNMVSTYYAKVYEENTNKKVIDRKFDPKGNRWIHGLKPNTEYYVFFHHVCSDKVYGSQKTWRTKSLYFTTPPPPPCNVTITGMHSWDVTTTTAVIGWDRNFGWQSPLNDGQGYLISWRKSGSNDDWKNDYADEWAARTLHHLEPGTGYDVIVKPQCYEGSWGEVSDIFYVETLPDKDKCGGKLGSYAVPAINNSSNMYYYNGTVLSNQPVSQSSATLTFKSGTAVELNPGFVATVSGSGGFVALAYNPATCQESTVANGASATAGSDVQKFANIESDNALDASKLRVAKKYKVYPNPNRGSFSIDFKEKDMVIKSITVYDMFGVRILHRRYNRRLDVEQYALRLAKSGLYKIAIRAASGVEYESLLVEF